MKLPDARHEQPLTSLIRPFLASFRPRTPPPCSPPTPPSPPPRSFPRPPCATWTCTAPHRTASPNRTTAPATTITATPLAAAMHNDPLCRTRDDGNRRAPHSHPTCASKAPLLHNIRFFLCTARPNWIALARMRSTNATFLGRPPFITSGACECSIAPMTGDGESRTSPTYQSMVSCPWS